MSDQQAKIRNLAKLSEGEAGVSREQKIIESPPDWKRIASAGLLPNESVAALYKFSQTKNLQDCFKVLEEKECIRGLVQALKIENDTATIDYVMTVIYELIRDDTMRADRILQLAADEGLGSPTSLLKDVLTRAKTSYTADKAAFLCTSFMVHKGVATPDEVVSLATILVEQYHGLTPSGALSALCNLLKLHQFRTPIWNIPGAHNVFQSNLNVNKDSTTVYYAIFAVWLLAFSEKFIRYIAESGLLKAAIDVFQKNKKEKVVRLGLQVIQNCLKDETAIETIIQSDVCHTLTLLEYENWRDPDLYSQIREANANIANQIKQFSNFDRYNRELSKGHMKWSFLHSEKFWTENYMYFEQDEFDVIKKMVQMLRSRDHTTLAVLCFDLGEFARLHPTGKLILSKLRAKEMVMSLMTHRDREVSREALLCMQKMMLNRWQDAAGGGTAKA